MRATSLLLLLALAGCGAPPASAPAVAPPVATFSIVAWDPETGDLGVAVQSKVFGVGSIVPYVRADVGAVATQALAEPRYGPEGLGLMDDGLPAPAALERLVASDAGRARRQVGLVDAKGRPAAFTGTGCHPWAGQVIGAHHCCQGNILAGEAVVKAMSAAFEQTQAPFPERLVAALEAGQAAGGDKRGRQSAALMVARRFGGYRGANDRWIDIRVEDHPQPIRELARLLVKRRAFLPTPPVPAPIRGPDEDTVREPRVGTSARPSARETWRRWKALHAAEDWRGIRALCVADWSRHGEGDGSLAALETTERETDSTQAKARRGVYLGTTLRDGKAWLRFAVRGEAAPVDVLLVKQDGAWRIIP